MLVWGGDVQTLEKVLHLASTFKELSGRKVLTMADMLALSHFREVGPGMAYACPRSCELHHQCQYRLHTFL